MTKPLKEYVRQVLAEHDRGEKIREAIEYAQRAVTSFEKGRNWRRKGTRRAVFWEVAVDELIALTQDDPGMVVIEHNDTVSFIFDDAVLVRIKKADLTLHSSNYPTPTAELFHDHQEDLFGYEGLQRVEAVYVPNRFETEIVWSGIVARDGHAELWHFELAPPIAAPIAVLPTPAQASATDLAKVKNQAKDANRKKQGGDDK